VSDRQSLSLSPDEFRRLGYAVIDRLAGHLEALDGLPPVAPADSQWSHGKIPPCPDGPSDPLGALEYLFDEILPRGQFGNHPRFFARIPGPSNPLSVLADLAGVGVNAFAGSWTGGAGVSAL
jgi:aromatic-L-amino-acid decarboxylase